MVVDANPTRQRPVRSALMRNTIPRSGGVVNRGNLGGQVGGDLLTRPVPFAHLVDLPVNLPVKPLDLVNQIEMAVSA